MHHQHHVRHNAKFNWSFPKSCQQLTDDQLNARRQFCLDYQGDLFRELIDLPFVFSDESRFCDAPDSHPIWIRRGEIKFSALAPKNKFPRFSLMVWGAIGPGLKSELIFFDNANINSERYIQSLQNFFLQTDMNYGNRKWVFVQDGAPCHVSQYSISSLCNHCLLHPVWPPNSPDLNPIEMVWAVMKQRINWDIIYNIEQAKAQILQIWNAIPQASIDALCLSFANRIAMVRDARGQTIQPLLSNHRTTVPSDYLQDRPNEPQFVPWSREEDLQINDMRHQIGRKSWNVIARLFPGRSPTALKNRWRTLEIAEKNPRRSEERENSE
jgi:hypothetical protein